MNADTILVALAVLAATAWLASRAWARARRRYESGPCCGAGCGCAGPALFGAKSSKGRKKSAQPTGR